MFLKESNPHLRLTCYYGFPERERRREAWEFLRLLAAKSSLPWCIAGDFNDILHAPNKKGVHPHPASLLNGFRNVVEDCALIEIDLLGRKYTWEKSRGSENWGRERLDRVFATESWWRPFPLCNLRLLHTICSDDEPIHLELRSLSHTKRQFRFRFENTWLKEESFHEEVCEYWGSLSSMQFLPKLIDIFTFMQKWGKKFFNMFREKIKMQKQVLEQYGDCSDEESTKKYFEAKKKLEEILIHEEIYWKQRAKAFWLAEGDSNTKFFHAYVSKRKKINFITRLKIEAGEIVEDHDGMTRIVGDYFTDLFANAGPTRDIVFEGEGGIISDEQNSKLTEDFSFTEFTAAIKDMHPDKSSGPDGLNPAFFPALLEYVRKGCI